jgi:hypothetical protein
VTVSVTVVVTVTLVVTLTVAVVVAVRVVYAVFVSVTVAAGGCGVGVGTGAAGVAVGDCGALGAGLTAAPVAPGRWAASDPPASHEMVRAIIPAPITTANHEPLAVRRFWALGSESAWRGAYLVSPPATLGMSWVGLGISVSRVVNVFASPAHRSDV